MPRELYYRYANKKILLLLSGSNQLIDLAHYRFWVSLSCQANNQWRDLNQIEFRLEMYDASEYNGGWLLTSFATFHDICNHNTSYTETNFLNGQYWIFTYLLIFADPLSQQFNHTNLPAPPLHHIEMNIFHYFLG